MFTNNPNLNHPPKKGRRPLVTKSLHYRRTALRFGNLLHRERKLADAYSVVEVGKEIY